MTQEISENDPLDPVKIRKDLAQQSFQIKEKRDIELKVWSLVFKLCLALAVFSVLIPFFWRPDLRPNLEESRRLPAGQVTIYTEPLGAHLLREAHEKEGEFLGRSGESLLLSELLGESPSEESGQSIELRIEKPGFRPMIRSIRAFDLQGKVWPHPQQPPLRLDWAGPVGFLWYDLAQERRGFFFGLILGLFGATMAGMRFGQIQREARKREALKEADKDKDPLTGLSVMGHQVLNRLGRGAQSITYRALCEENYQTIRALRFCRAAQVDDHLLQLWERERATYAKLDHPNVLKIYQTKRFDNTFVFLMKFIDGQDLKSLTSRYPLSPEEALPIFEGLAAGLDHCHAKGIIHRDLKPANVMLDADGTPIIIDFGVATDKDAGTLTATGALKGTALYLSPEQSMSTKSKNLTGASDQFTLGLMLYESLTSAWPYPDTEEIYTVIYHRFSELPIPLRQKAPHLSEYLEVAVMRMLSPDPSERYPTCREAIAAVRRAARLS